nr:hypothetical protein [uncultured Arsenicibacter sp.]
MEALTKFHSTAAKETGFRGNIGNLFSAMLSVAMSGNVDTVETNFVYWHALTRIGKEEFYKALEWLHEKKYLIYEKGAGQIKGRIVFKISEINQVGLPTHEATDKHTDSLPDRVGNPTQMATDSATDNLPDPLTHIRGHGRAEKDSLIVNNNNFFQSVSHTHIRARPTDDGQTEEEIGEEEIVSVEGRQYTKTQVFALWDKKYNSYYRTKLTQPIKHQLTFLEVCEGAYLNIVLNPRVSISTKNGLVQSLEWYVTEIVEGKYNLAGEQLNENKPKRNHGNTNHAEKNAGTGARKEVDLQGALARMFGGGDTGFGGFANSDFQPVS